ncbi:hydroxymethylglutaryl-CoA reductase [Luteolibacter sp. GHJ8]|uniref:hydroxymethylglutaryl-CoA reductase (NADPH) n=1 Tax=Luteolibacter rhizosphaerae TaxID=2989719 RepID=A0ABT3G6J7_9BACT|nr:hydroxymethylglutaryl-CoA reductase [Luteolibacter rhizosphaerae]MCW1915469.1 hydroxymethylglutaryl-CoA reductase [Luteolibacter rhizosphaerae]
MTGKRGLTQQHVMRILGGESPDVVAARLAPDLANLPDVPAGSAKVTRERAEALWEETGLDQESRKTLLDGAAAEELPLYQGNIENAIGLMKMPLGLAGPLRINGVSAKGDYHIPLATTEAALVASYHRGCRLLTAAGGCSAMVLYESLSRAPAFVFKTAPDACRFIIWAMERLEDFQKVAATTTSHGKLIDMGVTMEGNHVYLNFEFTTGDASGQNMVTIAGQAICDFIVENSPVSPVRHYVESNLSGDKKASTKAYTTTRGKKVTAEALLSAELVKKHLHTTPRAMEQYWQMSAIGGVLSGTLGIHGHFANGLTALYLATGQDAACVAESATGVTRFEVTAEGDLYATVTLPGIMVGTVGGGTGLPTQKACLQLMGLHGAGKARALAEVCAGLLLAGELSIIGALSAGHFARAHRKLARDRK